MTEWFLKRSSWRSVSEMKISPGPLWPSAMSSSKPERLSEKRKKKWKMLKTNEERGLIFEIRDNLRKKISMCNNKKREEKKQSSTLPCASARIPTTQHYGVNLIPESELNKR